jgi:hypothetical protein
VPALTETDPMKLEQFIASAQEAGVTVGA